jgi:hypothetical protein
MNQAYCTEDHQMYHAHRFFKEVPALEKVSLRRALVCPECNGKAFFRTQSKDGRAPCFGSNEHAPNCEFKSVEANGFASGRDEFVSMIQNSGDRLIIDLHSSKRPNGHEIRNGVETRRQPTRRHQIRSDDQSIGASSTRKLRGILYGLSNNLHFRNSEISVECGGFETLPVKEFFVEFSEVKDREFKGKKRGYWGTIDNPGETESGLWLNAGGITDFSVVIDRSLINKFYENFGITAAKDLAGAQILILGKCRVSKKRKPFVKLIELSHAHVQLLNPPFVDRAHRH